VKTEKVSLNFSRPFLPSGILEKLPHRLYMKDCFEEVNKKKFFETFVLGALALILSFNVLIPFLTLKSVQES
jgi:hypothetical protein